MGCVWRGVCRSWGRERLAALKKNKACCGWEEARGGSMRKRRLLTRCARMMVSDNMVDALHEEEAQMDGDAPVAQVATRAAHLLQKVALHLCPCPPPRWRSRYRRR